MTFDLTTRDALNRVMDEIAENPRGHPERIRPLSRDGRTLLYTHPNPALEITFEIDQQRQVVYILHVAAPRIDTGKPVFVSYSHKDVDWLTRIRTWLAPLEQRGLLRIWADTDITPGEEWRKEIQRALDQARVALLLVSQAFLASTFVQRKELPDLLDAAKEKGTLILWIAVGDSLYTEYAIERYQAVNDPSRPLATLAKEEIDTVLKGIYGKVKSAVELQ